MSRERVVAILCECDGCTFAEAEELIEQTIEEMDACNYDMLECEEILADNLGLEMDYIFDLLV